MSDSDSIVRATHSIARVSSAVAETARRFVSLNILLSHSTSLKVIRKDTVEYGMCKSLLVFHCNYVSRPFLVSEIFSVKKWRDLETRGRGRSRSLNIAPFDRSYTTFYWSAIVNIARC